MLEDVNCNNNNMSWKYDKTRVCQVHGSMTTVPWKDFGRLCRFDDLIVDDRPITISSYESFRGHALSRFDVLMIDPSPSLATNHLLRILDVLHSHRWFLATFWTQVDKCIVDYHSFRGHALSVHLKSFMQYLCLSIMSCLQVCFT